MFSHQAMQREGGHLSTDFHMPEFDGFEGLKDIEQGFELHDIMSGNNNDHNVVIQGGNSDNSGFEITKQGNNNNVESKKDEKHNTDVVFMPSRKIRWSGPLHMRFLKAVDIIGLQKLTPKKVLKLMNVPELTRRNVASHLQKYRLFLKRFADKNFPEMKDRESALHAAFLKTMPVFNSKQHSSDISIPYPLSFFRSMLEWKRTSFADFNDGFSEPVYVHPSVTLSASNRGRTNNVSCGRRNRDTHINGAVLPPMQNHDQNVSCGPRNDGTHFNGAVLPPMQNHDQNVSCGPRNRGTHSNGAVLPSIQNHDQNVSCGPRNRGTHFNGSVLPPMQNHDQIVSYGPRNQVTPFYPNPNNNGMTNFFKPPQVNGNPTVFGPDQGKLGGQGIYKVNGFEINCFDTANGTTAVTDHIVIPSTELGQANFNGYITQEEQPFSPFSAVNNNMLFPQQSLGLLSPCLEPGPISTSVIGAGPVTPPQSQPSKDLFDDNEMWSDEFVASLLDDIRPLLED